MNVSDVDFNVVENEVNKYEFNDDWFTAMRESYYELVELSDEVIESLNKTENEKEVSHEDKAQSDLVSTNKFKQEEKLVTQLAKQVESLTKSISGSVDKLGTEIRKMSYSAENVARIDAFKRDLAGLDEKIDCRFQSIFNQYMCLLSDTEVKEKETLRDSFVSLEKAKIDNLLILLNQKVMDKIPPSNSNFSEKKDDQTYLKKIDPPHYKGDIVQYADVVRKWKAQVGKAGLSPESELDRLRDRVPAQASKALYGAGVYKVPSLGIYSSPAS